MNKSTLGRVVPLMLRGRQLLLKRRKGWGGILLDVSVLNASLTLTVVLLRSAKMRMKLQLPLVSPDYSANENVFYFVYLSYSFLVIVIFSILLQQDCPNGRLTPAKFVDMYKMFFPSGNAEEFCDHVFRTFDMDKNGYIDFKVSDGVLLSPFKIQEVNYFCTFTEALGTYFHQTFPTIPLFALNNDWGPI